jgi:hypothetical protein
MALIPALYLGWLRVRKRPRELAWWWLAAAFFVSWIADSAADLLPQSAGWVPSLVYPVAQTAIVGAVLLPKKAATVLLWLLAGFGVLAALWQATPGPDLLLRAAAWLTIVGIVWYRDDLPYRLRLCFLMYFGVGLAMWMVHLEWLVVATWYPYQLARLAGLLLFCWAARLPVRALAIATSATPDYASVSPSTPGPS